MRGVLSHGHVRLQVPDQGSRPASSLCMLELTPQQVALLEKLRDAGFGLAAFPLYASYVGVRKENCVMLLAPIAGGGMQPFGEPCFLVGGNLGVRMTRDGREWFVWKKEQVEATPERLEELQRFTAEVRAVLGATGTT